MRKIPVIDVSGRNKGIAEREELARTFEKVAREVGFMYVVNHGIDQSVLTGAFDAAKEFHSWPMEKKLALELNEAHRGYQPPNSVKLKASSKFAPAKKPSSRAAFVVRNEVDTTAPDFDPSLPLQGPNQWPEGEDGFRQKVTTYRDAVTNLGMSLLPAMSVAVGEAEDYLGQFFAPPTTTFSLLHYAPDPNAEPDQFGSAPHTDYGFLTILAQDNVGGLEVQSTDGEWIAAPPMEGAYVVNIGDILARWTNDQFRSTPHRVINRSPDKDRYSLPFMLDPSLSAPIKVLNKFDSPEATEKYPPTRFGDYFAGRLGTNYVGRKVA